MCIITYLSGILAGRCSNHINLVVGMGLKVNRAETTAVVVTKDQCLFNQIRFNGVCRTVFIDDLECKCCRSIRIIAPALATVKTPVRCIDENLRCAVGIFNMHNFHVVSDQLVLFPSSAYHCPVNSDPAAGSLNLPDTVFTIEPVADMGEHSTAPGLVFTVDAAL